MESKQFVAEFQALLSTCPRYNLKRVQTQNCEYADTAIRSNNCYYSFCVFYCEDVYYSRYSRKCVDCSGVTFCIGCEGCIESTDCINCYYCAFCRDCRDCAECDYCTDCSSCQDCFGCIGLHQKKYCFFNEQLSRSEYQAWRQAANAADHEQSALIERRLAELRGKTGLLTIHQFRCEESVGEHLSESRNCWQCYDSFKLEDCLYNIETNGNRDSCDLSVCFEAELCYSCVQAR